MVVQDGFREPKDAWIYFMKRISRENNYAARFMLALQPSQLTSHIIQMGFSRSSLGGEVRRTERSCGCQSNFVKLPMAECQSVIDVGIRTYKECSERV